MQINDTKKIFDKIFGNNIKLLVEQVDDSHMGYYKLEYQYLSGDYFITFENCEGRFDIYISDAEGAQSSLYRLKKYEAYTNEQNVEKAVISLHDILEERFFDLLIEKDGRFYSKKTDGTIEEI